MKQWQPDVPDEQMINEARAEDLARSIARWESSPDGRSHTAFDRDGNVVAIGCGGGRFQRDVDPNLIAQDRAGVDSQDYTAADEAC